MGQRRAPPYELTVLVCVRERDGGRAACGSRGSDALAGLLREYVRDHGLKGHIRIAKSQCLDICEEGPNIAVFPQDHWFTACGEAEVEEILARYIHPIERRVKGGGEGSSQGGS